MNTPEEFWANVKRSPGCWLWQGRRSPNGYGYIFWKGRITSAHRVAYELEHGEPPRRTKAIDTAVVMHSCDEPMCCRPNHLSLGTQRENMAAKAARGRAFSLRGSENGNAKLDEDDVREIRRALELGLTQRQVSRAFEVSQVVISRINTGKVWRHVTLRSPIDSVG